MNPALILAALDLAALVLEQIELSGMEHLDPETQAKLTAARDRINSRLDRLDRLSGDGAPEPE